MHRPTKDPFTRPAMQTLERLHAELGGRILDNKSEGDSLRLQMQQVEAVIKMLDPTFNVNGLSVRRRQGNPWFKRGTLYREAVGVLRTATEPMTGRDMALALLASKGIQDATPSQITMLAQSIQSSLQNHKGKSVEITNEGMPARWQLKNRDIKGD